MTDAQAARRLLMRLTDETSDAINAGDMELFKALMDVPAKVYMETVLQEETRK